MTTRFPLNCVFLLREGGHSMRQCFLILVALLPCVALNAGVKRPGSPAFDPQQSAALFVGISNFDDKQIEKVPYAIDDAVDLAYELAMDQQPRLVLPNAVVLALSSGEPCKSESR